MKKAYWVMKNPNNTAEWVEMSGKQFHDFVTSPAAKGRYFMDCGDYKIEVSPEQYREWKRETRHHQYLQTFEDEVLILSLERLAADLDISRDELTADISVNIEDEALNNIYLQRLSKAILSLEDDERRFIAEMFMRDKPKTEREMEALTGIPNQTVHYRKKKVLKKLKNYLGKTQKSGQ